MIGGVLESACTAPLGVLPVFVNAGAALLPALVAGAASVLALLLRPRELVRTCARNPLATAGGLLGVVIAAGVIWWTMIPGAARASAGPATISMPRQIDWVKLALTHLQEQRLPTTREAGEIVTPAAVLDHALVFRRDMGRSGYGGTVSPTSLTPLWQYAPELAMVLSSPLVSGGRVYGTTCVLDPPGSYGSIVCLDAATGKLLWTTEQDAIGKSFKGIFSSPALTADGKYLVVGQGLHQDEACALICLEAQTGKVRWTVPTPLHIEGSPAIEGDLVVAGAGAIEQGADHKPAGDPNGVGHPGMVLGVRISDGKLLWKHTVNDPESSPAMRDGVVYIGSGINGNAVAALRTQSDEELKAGGLSREIWKTPTPTPALGAITLCDDLVLVGSGKGDFVFAAKDPEGYVFALDQKTGAIRWSVKLPDTVLGPIAVRDGIAICPVRNGQIVALDTRQNGRILWHQRINDQSPVLAGTVFSGSHVYAVSQDGYLAILDAANGALLQRLYLNSPDRPGEMGLSVSAPVLVDGKVYVGSETGGLRCLTSK